MSSIFSKIFSKKTSERFFPKEDRERIVHAIQMAEQQTSGELRVFIESKCETNDALERAQQVFYGLKMQETQAHNAVILYIALQDKKLAIFADEGIYVKAGKVFWENEVQGILTHFNKENYTVGIIETITDLGQVLRLHFPYDATTDKNELPDDIVFGR